MTLEIRHAGPADAGAIAALHAESWRGTYRGVFSDAFLDREVHEERRRHWRECLETAPGPDQGVLLAEEDGACLGFICIRLEGEPGWGPLLDNLHVHPGRKGGGIGRRLIQAGLDWVKASGRHDRWHLWVVEGNAPTRRVYEHLGWEPGEPGLHTAPDGAPYPVRRYTQRI